MQLPGRISTVLGAAAVATILSTAPALAHVSANPGEAAAGGFSYHAFRVGHGCDGSPTTKVTVNIPEGVVSVKPQELAGWKIDVGRGPITPYDNHGETISEGVTEVSWTADTPLPDDHMQQFALSMKMPDKAGETIYFKVLQDCRQGVLRWIEIPAEGQSEPEHPAAGVKLVESGSDAHGHTGSADGEMTMGDDPGTEADGADDGHGEMSETAAQSGTVDDDGSRTLAVIALLAGVAGLVMGGASLVLGRR